MSLRSEAVEIVAQQVHAQQIENTNFPIAWENCAHIYRVASRLKAESVLDVLLDFLGARAAEVGEEMERAFMRADLRSEDIIGYGRGRERSQILVLVAALRGTTEEEETT